MTSSMRLQVSVNFRTWQHQKRYFFARWLKSMGIMALVALSLDALQLARVDNDVSKRQEWM